MSTPAGETARQVRTFIAVGIVTAAVNLATFTALVLAGVPYLAAAVAGFALSTLTSYAGNRRYTFRVAGPPSPREAGLFLAVQVAGLLVNLAVLTAGVELLGVAPIPSELVAALTQSTFTFLVNRRWTFNPRRRQA